MIASEPLTTQVRRVLIESNDRLSPQELYSRFINECTQLNIEEKDFYSNILKPAYKSINWDLINKGNNEAVRQVIMFCPECGTMNEEKGNYCAECGHQLDLLT
jgi:rRNA maturation endonuclease Nob1